MFFDRFSALTFAVISGLSVGTAAVTSNPGANEYRFQEEVVFYTRKIPAKCHTNPRPLKGAHALIGIDTEAC